MFMLDAQWRRAYLSPNEGGVHRACTRLGKSTTWGRGLRLPLGDSSEVPPEMRFEGWPLTGGGTHPLPRLGWEAGRFQGAGLPTPALSVHWNQLLGHTHEGHIISGAEADAQICLLTHVYLISALHKAGANCQSPGAVFRHLNPGGSGL